MIVENIYISRSDSVNANQHKHTAWEIILNISGSGTNNIEKEETDFYPGSILICPPNVYHGKKATEGYFRDIYITFTDSYIVEKLKSHYYKDDDEYKIEKLMFMIHNIYHNKPSGYKNIINSLFESICNILASWDENDKSNNCIEILKNEIIMNFTNPDFKIEYAMNNINYCRDYVRRCFKKEMKLTPIKYLNTLRIENAKKILLSEIYPKYSINDVAYMSGFYDAGYFTRLFKKYTGCVPSEMVHKNN